MSYIHLVMGAGGFFIGTAAGFIMHRSDYCVAGMFRDLFLFHSTRMLKTLVVLVVVSMLFFEVIRLTGFVAVPFPFFGPPSLVNILGGFLFGIGMVLAGGCVVGCLYKMGAGNLPGMLTFTGLVAGSTFYAELHPWWSGISKSLTFPTKSITVPQLLGLPPWLPVFLMVLILSLCISYWFKTGAFQNSAVVEGYIQPWKAALLLAFLGCASVLLLGMPMGITTSYTKFGASILQSFAPEYFGSLAYFSLVPLNYIPPLGGGMLTGGPGPALDAVALVQYPIIFGILIGAAVSAVLLGEWHLCCNLPWRQVLSAVAGGVIMGVASRMAPACNIWHLFGGLPILALQSILFLAGLLPGAWLGGVVLKRIVMPQ